MTGNAPPLSTPPGPSPLIGSGPVRHTRLRPQRHAFAYEHFFWMLPMRALARQAVPAVRRNRWGALAFHDADHGEGGPDALAWLDGLLRQAGLPVADWADGEVWLQTFPRVWGHTFKPVSFWWVHRADRRLMAVVAEVNNTFGERHAYVLHGEGLKLGGEVQADKVFHVSPFCQVNGQYRFRFMRTGSWGRAAGGDATAERVIVCIDHDDEQGPLLRTSQAGQLSPLTPQSARKLLWQHPFMTLAVVLRIHWHALRVWLKGVPFYRKPPAPPALMTRSETP
jgi:uncharacterized protein